MLFEFQTAEQILSLTGKPLKPIDSRSWIVCVSAEHCSDTMEGCGDKSA